jgi:GNAT superfamily N-acetyltransferase
MTARPPWMGEMQEIRLRSATSADRDRIGRFLATMDRAGLYERHFSHGEGPNLALLERIERIEHQDRVAILALGLDGEVVGHGEYVAQDEAAEFALMVLPRFRARGIGRRLLRALIDIATATGQRTLHGMIHATNARALKLAADCGLRPQPSGDRTVVIVSRALVASVDTAPAGLAPIAARNPIPIVRHDPDRTPLHRRPGPGAPLRARG